MYTAVCTVGGMRLKLQLSYDSISYVFFAGRGVNAGLCNSSTHKVDEDIGSSHFHLTCFVL